MFVLISWPKVRAAGLLPLGLIPSLPISELERVHRLRIVTLEDEALDIPAFDYLPYTDCLLLSKSSGKILNTTVPTLFSFSDLDLHDAWSSWTVICLNLKGELVLLCFNLDHSFDYFISFSFFPRVLANSGMSLSWLISLVPTLMLAEERRVFFGELSIDGLPWRRIYYYLPSLVMRWRMLCIKFASSFGNGNSMWVVLPKLNNNN